MITTLSPGGEAGSQLDGMHHPLAWRFRFGGPKAGELAFGLLCWSPPKAIQEDATDGMAADTSGDAGQQ